jgi:hypothetical protein
MATFNSASDKVLAGNEVRQGAARPVEAAAKAPYRSPELFVIGPAAELVQGGRGRYADANGPSFWDF